MSVWLLAYMYESPSNSKLLNLLSLATPKTDKVFTLEDTYPERFFKWADDFIHYIR